MWMRARRRLSRVCFPYLESSKKKGRVDHKDSFLDYYEEERRRGITIFSKQALLKINRSPKEGFSKDDLARSFTLIDTPGHPELWGETERALMAMDYCIILISALDSVTNEDQVLWDLVSSYRIPAFLFINKMDRPSAKKEELIYSLREAFGEGIVDFEDLYAGDRALFLENIAILDEDIMEEYISNGNISPSGIKRLISERKLFPCLFGSALKDQNTGLLVQMMVDYTEPKVYPEVKAALCYKINKDQKGKRFSWIKVTGGWINPKDILKVVDSDRNVRDIKPDQIFSPNGPGLIQETTAKAGETAVLSGVELLIPGLGIGEEAGLKDKYKKIIKSSFKTRVKVSESTNTYDIFLRFSELCEEFCEVEVRYDDKYNEINVLCTGRLEAQVLKALMKSRFSVDIDFLDPEEISKLDNKRALEEELFLENIGLLNDINQENTEKKEKTENKKKGVRACEDDLKGEKSLGDEKHPGDMNRGLLIDGKDKVPVEKTKSSGKKENEALLGEGLKKDAELLAIFNATLGRNTKKSEKTNAQDSTMESRKMRKSEAPPKVIVNIPDQKESYLLVDGYNIIYAWEELSKLASDNLGAARSLLCDVLADYRAFKGMTLILVFDAYKVPSNRGSVEKYHDIYIVYTKEAETADAYIEKTVHEIAKGQRVTVATNDNLEQTISFGAGAVRMTAGELKADVSATNKEMYDKYLSRIEKLENRIKI